MDKYFLNSIQPNFDYLSGSQVWKNNATPFLEENFVVPNLNGLCASSAGITFDKLKLPDSLFALGNVGAIDFKTIGVGELDYFKGTEVGLTYEKDFLRADNLFVGEENPNWHIIDANINIKSLAQSENLGNFYTTPQVADEKKQLLNALPFENISLGSLTTKQFKENGYTATLTSPFGETAEITLIRINNSGTQLPCGHALSGYIFHNATGVSAALCGEILDGKSTTDFGIASNGIAFYTTANLYTEDKCLGYAFAHLNSFSVDKNIYWRDNKKFKNNSSCSHNH